MRIITVYEHEMLLVDDAPNGVAFEQRHFNSLADRLGKKDESSFPFYSLVKYHHKDGVKFKQYVGAIQVGDLTIEILPKTDSGAGAEKKWRSILLYMLSKVYNLQIRSESIAPQHLRHSTILDFVVLRFLDETEHILHQGLVKTYRSLNENSTALKGKLLLQQQITKNVVHQERFYVRHTVYDRSHIMNRIIRQTLVCLSSYSKNPAICQRANIYLSCFPDLDPVPINEDIFTRLVFNRKTDGYRDAMALAELILFNNMPDLQTGRKDTLALLFDMNRLWEKFVFVTLRRYLDPRLYSVKDQVSRLFWKTRTIRPDIVINGPNGLAILDTKWKRPADSPSDNDLHQMYVYFRYFNAKKVALIYPSPAGMPPPPGITGLFVDGTNTPCSSINLPVPDWNGNGNGQAWQQDLAKVVENWL
jgi:5-methylcytosine-specific restriction enzyme subunit McrC